MMSSERVQELEHVRVTSEVALRGAPGLRVTFDDGARPDAATVSSVPFGVESVHEDGTLEAPARTR